MKGCRLFRSITALAVFTVALGCLQPVLAQACVVAQAGSLRQQQPVTGMSMSSSAHAGHGCSRASSVQDQVPSVHDLDSQLAETTESCVQRCLQSQLPLVLPFPAGLDLAAVALTDGSLSASMVHVSQFVFRLDRPPSFAFA